MNNIEQLLLYKQIENNLIKNFEIECPSKNENESIMTNKELILDEFEKWYNFWDVRDPILSDPNIDMTNKKNILLFIKKHICETKKIGILNEIEDIGLKDEFFSRMNNKNKK